MSHFVGSRSEESRSAVLELLEKVTRLNKQLELKESQSCKAERDMDQVQTTSDLHYTRVGLHATTGASCRELFPLSDVFFFFVLLYIMRHFEALCMV